MILNVVFKNIFVVNETTLEQVYHKNYGLKYEFRDFIIFVIRHQLEEFVQDLIMKENLIIGIFEFLKLFEDSLNFVFMHISLFDQQQIIDISIVGKLIRDQL